jgi:hypothetical protein
MKGNIFDKIRKASNKYIEYMIACDCVAKEAQKHIDWDNNVSCEYYPGDGICIMIDEHVCYANTFFDLVEESERRITMEAHVMKLENNCVIVDEEYFNEIKKKAESNQERINEIAEEKFLEYVKDSGIKLSYEVNGVPYIFHYDLLSELNYEERGYPESVSEKVKYTIADDITEALNDKLKGLKDEALNYALSEFDKRKYGLEATVKIWKHFALIFIITTIVLTIRLFIQL